MKRIYYILGFMMLALVSCNKDELFEDADGQRGEYITIVADAPHSTASTKVAYNDNEVNKVSVLWKESGEKFSVIRGGVNEVFSQTQDNSDNSNVFGGVIPGGEGAFYAFYPVTDATDITAVPYNLSVQNGSLDESKNYMVANADILNDGSELAFSQLTAILKPAFTGMEDGENISSVSLTFNNNSSFCVNGKINLATGSYVVGNDNVNTIQISGIDDPTAPMYIYLPAIPQGTEIEFEVRSSKSNIYSGKLITSKAVQAGKLYKSTIALVNTRVWTRGVVASKVMSGSGASEADPILISNASDLQWLIDNCAENAGKCKYYKLTQDLVINSSNTEGAEWTPISSFTGFFNGDNHIISGNLYGASVQASEDYFGFFGKIVSGSEVKNLKMFLTAIGGNNSSNSAKSYVGAFAGKNAGNIINCSIVANSIVRGGEVKSDIYTGGFVGYNSGSIIDCTNNASVYGGTVVYSGNPLTGGFVGVQGENNNAIIKSCTNNGNVTGGNRTNGNNGSSYTGGFIGNMTPKSGSLVSCINNGALKGGKAAGANSVTGGICGDFKLDNVIANCTNNGNIAGGEEGKYCNVGGLVGSCRGSISNSTNNGNVTGGKTYQLNSQNFQYGAECGTGGLAGTFPNGTLQNCINKGKIVAGLSQTHLYTGTLVGIRPVQSDGPTPKLCVHCKNEGTSNGEMPNIGKDNVNAENITCDH